MGVCASNSPINQSIEEMAANELEAIERDRKLERTNETSRDRLVKLWKAAEDNLADILKQSPTLAGCLDEELKKQGLVIKVMYVMPSLKSAAMECWLLVRRDEAGKVLITAKLASLYDPKFPTPQYYSPRSVAPNHPDNLTAGIKVTVEEFLVKLANYKTAIPLLIRSRNRG